MSSRALLLLAVLWSSACRGGPPTSDSSRPRPASWTPQMSDRGGDAEPVDPADVDIVALLAAETWEERLARDARLSIFRSGADAALAALEAGELDVESGEVAAALVAVGVAGPPSALQLIETWAVEGDRRSRAAALLARGALGVQPASFLSSRVAAEERFARSCAVLALALAGDVESRAELEMLVAEGGDLRAVAMGMIAYAEVAEAPPVSAPAMLWLDLRWEAARSFGRIDGHRFDALLEAHLERNTDFVDHVVLLPAAGVTRPGVRDHLLAYLLEHGGVAAVRASVVAMPSEVASLVRAGLWRPANGNEWNGLLAEVELGADATELHDVLQIASTEPSVRARAAALLLRDGVSDAMLLLESDLGAEDPAQRAFVAAALGASGDAQWLGQLDRMLLDGHPKVRATALAAKARLRNPGAGDEVRELLGAGPSLERRELTLALCEAARTGDMLPFVQFALDQLDVEAAAVESADAGRGEAPLDPIADVEREVALQLDRDSRLRLSTYLALHGRIAPRALVREALAAGEGEGFKPMMVRALARVPAQEDLALIASLFPQEGALGLNLELALALIHNRHATGERILRHAIWRAPFDRSCLAAAVVVDRGGVQALLNVLATPPERAASADKRRVGFALGELGGVEMVELLALRLRSGNPALQGAYLGALAGRTQE